MAEVLYSYTFVDPDNYKVDGIYSHSWLEQDRHTIEVMVSGRRKKRIEYTEARGVIQKALEIITRRRVKIDLRDEVEFLGKFRDALGRRMPPVTCACALIANIYGAPRAMYGNTTVQKRTGLDRKAVNTVYVERTNGHETEYKYARTKLDRLFSKVLKDEECMKSEFRDIRVYRGNLADGWLETNHMDTLWTTIKAHGGVSVDFYDTLMSATVDNESLRMLASGIRKGLHRAYTARKEKYVALFAINIEDKHHTIARAEYDNTERTLVVTYYDSLGYHGKEGKCGLIHQVFVEALKRAKENGYQWALGIDNIKYTMEDGTTQKQEDSINCGVFVCILMIEAAGGDKPEIHERTIDEGDIRKVRCIIARNHKIEGPSEPAKEGEVEIIRVSQGISGIPEQGPNRAQKIKRHEKRSQVIPRPRESIVLD
jgi:hypothetical protein